MTKIRAAIRHDPGKAAARPTLDDILDGPDEFGLLDVQAKRVGRNAPLEITNFDEISAFMDQHGRPPGQEGDLSEKLLARRLAGYLVNQALHDTLSPYDRHGLLTVPDVVTDNEKALILPNTLTQHSEPSKAPAEIFKPSIEAENVTSLDDIFASSEFDELDLGDESIFDIKHVPEVADRRQPDGIAQRTVCHDFYEFEHIFRDLHDGLKTGRIKTIRFQQSSRVQEGDAFIMEGVLCLIDKIGEHRLDSTGRYDPRLRVIFENGTESNHLLQSLAKRLFADETGRRVIRGAESVVDKFNNITHKDKRAGQIYFVTTLSDNSALKSIPSLIKIGYTEQTVEERTRNATRDIAFLEAPVKILASIECYNLNPNKFETLIHGFLHAQRLKVTLIGQDGKAYNPREWFAVPLDVAREVVRRIIDGSIVQYRMDNTTNRLVKKTT
ncbi:GIY-YIG nuclease family protein [Alcaligenes faecalis]|uniref:GIY-YIG nuclease family protein n=1 Tax=Alcaligenes TaxID=507 RepID=UPI001C832EF6|nr:GIY-YIG nuclease family protein [Alcaligenes faecalis]MBX6963907.1 GIY-YIG nuclease family protein [Providencia rettgeri]MBX7030557.1 GIY-YIG nuclease family protein [Alcaligenes faecalis]